MPTLDCPIRKKEWAEEVGERNGISSPSAPTPTGKPLEDAGPWEAAVQQIIEFQRLGDDWDGFGAKAPAGGVLASAIGLAYLLHGKGMDAPQRVAPGVDGSVILEWQDPDGTHAIVEIVQPLQAEVMLIEPGKPAKHWTLPTDQPSAANS